MREAESETKHRGLSKVIEDGLKEEQHFPKIPFLLTAQREETAFWRASKSSEKTGADKNIAQAKNKKRTFVIHSRGDSNKMREKKRGKKERLGKKKEDFHFNLEKR